MEYLSTVDPILRRVIREMGPCTLTPRNGRTPFESLSRAIAYQQLHARAAACIVKRFRSLVPGRRFPRPVDVLAIGGDALRGAGFSRPKIAALLDLAAKALDGTLPTSRIIRTMEDEIVIQRLIQVRGIGRWTAEMLLIFQLGRPDVLPVDDFGVRNGFRLAYKRRMMPTPKQVLRYGDRWRPYRTVAAWYLWRAADRARSVKPVPGITS